MIHLGDYNTLTAKRIVDFGIYLSDSENHEVLLPKKYLPHDLNLGDELKVFVYKDAENRFVATTIEPQIVINQYAYLEAKSKANFGVFFDWGLEKDLLVPNGLLAKELEPGEKTMVYLMVDSQTNRLVGCTKLSKTFETDVNELSEGQEILIQPFKESKIGFSCIVDSQYQGLLYHNEIFEPVKIGETFKGYIKKVREDGKLDLVLNPQGFKESQEVHTAQILEKLNQNEGFLPLHDKSSPEEISQLLKMSKKAFKKAIGGLYKEKKISITEDGIRLI